MIQCPAIPIDGGGGLSAALTAIDCQLDAVVHAGYGRIFGDDGALALALRALLVIWVALLGLGLIGGHLRMRTLGPRLFAFVLVLTFATAWPAYQAVVYGLLVGGPDQIASGFLGAQHGATHAFAAQLDRLFVGLVELGRSFDAQAGSDAKLKLASRMVWSSALLLLCSTVGVLVVARVVLAALLALGPVFIVLGLFRATRGLCEGWLRMALAFALVPMLVTLSGAGLLRVLGPAIDAIARDPLVAAQEQTPLLMLLLGCVIHLGLLLAMAWTASGIVRGWRFGGAASVDARVDMPAASPISIAANALGGSSTATVAQADAMLSALQAQANVSARSTTLLLPSAAVATSAPARDAATFRQDRLGQRFRARPAASALGGRFR
jgi:type IV secretion system protein VirB6